MSSRAVVIDGEASETDSEDEAQGKVYYETKLYPQSVWSYFF